MNEANIPYRPELLSTASDGLSREEIVNSSIEKAKNEFELATFEKIISFGDGRWDVQTAKNLNLDFVGIGEKYEALGDLAFRDYTNLNLPYLLNTLGILK